MTVVKIENNYEDGHHSTTTVDVADPPLDEAGLDDWWDDVVWPHTGDGHGVGADLGSCYTATIVAGPPSLVGVENEWVD